MKTIRLSTPVKHLRLDFCDTPYGMAYCWTVEHLGLIGRGNTKSDAISDWLDAVASEYPKQYAYAGEVL